MNVFVHDIGGSMDDGGKTARILDVQRMSTEDGPGIRTTVFFKGCSLACAWCHNPESISSEPQVHWIGDRCIGCRTCLPICPEKALSDGDHGIRIDRDSCHGCGLCAEACPGTALALLGQTRDLEDLTRDVLKDQTWFRTSGGGVTLSGGEPLLQAGFAAGFARRLQAEGVHTALDTCGLAPADSFHTILPFIDLVMFDLKIMDVKRHKQWTGSPNDRILFNLAHVSEYLRTNRPKTALWIRTPVIPGATDSKDNIRAMGDYLQSTCGDVLERWELCAFNNLCRDKYKRLDRVWDFEDQPLMLEESMETLTETARTSGVDPACVAWSGSTRTCDSQKGDGA